MNTGNLKLVGLLLILAPLSVLAGQSVNEHWDVDPNVKVSIENIAGIIDIQAWDRNEVQLSGELGDSVEELELNASTAAVQITVINRETRRIDNTSLKLKVPRAAIIEASAVSADIDVVGLDSEKLTASSVSGDVSVEARCQWVSIESVSGDVEFSGDSVRLSAESVSGDLDLFGISGEIAATTVSGDIELRADLIESGKFETVSGDMLVGGELSNSGRLSAESMSGDVVIRLPDSQAGRFKAQTFSGRISTDFGSVEHSRHGPGSRLKHVVGSSGAEIRVESFSGDIKLTHD